MLSSLSGGLVRVSTFRLKRVVPLAMVYLAEPDHIERPTVVVVMRLRALRPADDARVFLQISKAQRPTHRDVCALLVGVVDLPLRLRGDDAVAMPLVSSIFG